MCPHLSHASQPMLRNETLAASRRKLFTDRNPVTDSLSTAECRGIECDDRSVSRLPGVAHPRRPQYHRVVHGGVPSLGSRLFKSAENIDKRHGILDRCLQLFAYRASISHGSPFVLCDLYPNDGRWHDPSRLVRMFETGYGQGLRELLEFRG
jgi:hypothetical protein